MFEVVFVAFVVAFADAVAFALEAACFEVVAVV